MAPKLSTMCLQFPVIYSCTNGILLILLVYEVEYYGEKIKRGFKSIASVVQIGRHG